jgi:lysophospholipase L1-like esterase
VELTLDQLTYVLQFVHPEKTLAGLPGLSDATVAAVFGLDGTAYRRIRAGFTEAARRAAQELLEDPTFAGRVERLPFAAGAKVIGLGDSITDDYQSWLEVLRHLLALRRPGDGIAVVNAGVSGDTTTHLIGRFVEVAELQPDWVLCMAGTNDARTYGRQPAKTLVSLDETARNLVALRRFAATQTAARWVWITPAPVIEEKIAAHWYLGPLQLAWSNRDLRAVADVVRGQPDPVVDVQAVFGVPADPGLLLADGLHPSLAGQKAIVRAVVERLAGP